MRLRANTHKTNWIIGSAFKTNVVTMCGCLLPASSQDLHIPPGWRLALTAEPNPVLPKTQSQWDPRLCKIDDCWYCQMVTLIIFSALLMHEHLYWGKPDTKSYSICPRSHWAVFKNYSKKCTIIAYHWVTIAWYVIDTKLLHYNTLYIISHVFLLLTI